MKIIKNIKKNLIIAIGILGGAILTGLLWLLCSLPVITFGGASAAAYHTMNRTVFKRRGHIVAIFFESLKENLMLSIGIQFLLSLVLVFLGAIGNYLYSYGTNLSKLMALIPGIVGIIAVAFIIYLYPCIQKFEQSLWEHIRLSFYMTFRHLFTSAALVAAIVAIGFISYIYPWMLFILPGFWLILQGLFIEPILERYVSRHSESGVFSEGEDEYESEQDDESENDLVGGAEEKIKNNAEYKSKDNPKDNQDADEGIPTVRKKKRRLKRFWRKKTSADLYEEKYQKDEREAANKKLPHGQINRSSDYEEESLLSEEELREKEFRDRIIDKHLKED